MTDIDFLRDILSHALCDFMECGECHEFFGSSDCPNCGMTAEEFVEHVKHIYRKAEGQPIPIWTDEEFLGLFKDEN